jgi:leucyl-tRNA synthetase
MAMPYKPNEIEPKWQRIWQDTDAFRVSPKSDKPKYYLLDMFPYPSGHGLHVGHLKGYIASDIVARHKRMSGFNVLHPMGWDSFGLPTERQAERDNLPPSEVTRRNITTFKTQMNMVGLSYDWDREFATSDPSFFRWTQWIFLKLFEMGLAYEANVPVNWCPALGTVLANEEVKDGVYIETGDPVERRIMRQWMLKITAYADRLLDDLVKVDWPEQVKELQRNWIGRSEGAEIFFEVEDYGPITVFTTRPDTLFGATFFVLSPEHPAVEKITTSERSDVVSGYVEKAGRMSEIDRTDMTREKTGVFTGAYAVNPANNDRIPVFIADYVLMGYGTGAIMAVPGQDQRDWDFAARYDLPIIRTIRPPDDFEGQAYVGEGPAINSGFLDGLGVEEAKRRMIEWLEREGKGRRAVTYRLRDWLFSRQRYWGEPLPIIHGPNGELEPETNLPLLLPERIPEEDSLREHEPFSPLERAIDWVRTALPSTGGPAKRDTNVMPQWAGSSWYYLRFIDPRNAKTPWDIEFEDIWMPVDLYVGGIEHATLHLLYARFWHKVLYDCGLVSTEEPFQRLFNQGMVHSRSYRDNSGRYYYPEQVYEKDGEWLTKDGDLPLNSRIEKMSKSRYNVIRPEQVVEEYGADSLRLYEVFMGPLKANAIWQTDGLSGTRRFLDRAWHMFEVSKAYSDIEDSEEIERALHQTIKKVTEDLENLRLNTAISQLMIFVNQATAQDGVSRDTLSRFIRLLAPFAPHVCEEMWQSLGNEELVLNAPWPEYDPEKCIESEVTIVVQVNGKLRARLVRPSGAEEASVRAAALDQQTVRQQIGDKEIVNVIYIPDKLINIVVN